MPTPKPRTDLPDDVAGKLADLYQQLSTPVIACKLYAELLSDKEKKRFPETSEVLLRMPLVFAELRGLSVELASIELALEASFIDYGTHRSLRRQIGEPLDELQSKVIPDWDPDTGKLVFEGEIVRKVSGRAENVRIVLGSFQELGWPSLIDNPLPGGADSNKLRETIRTLNKGLSVIRFYADGKAKGVLWQY